MRRRVIIVLTDGLRPDAVTPAIMPSLYSLSHDYTRLANARTIRPSTTVAALASLATGVAPATHLLTEPGLEFLKGLGSLRPVADELERRGVLTTVVAGRMSGAARSVVRALTGAAGVARVVLEGLRAPEIAAAALEVSDGESELLIVYLPDCDRAGHTEGWMSPAYLAAASELDAAVAMVAGAASRDLLVILSDHGGGGVDTRDHHEPHPLNEHIPLTLAGPTVRRRFLIGQPASLLDVPPTVLWYFSVPIPAGYEGHVLAEAFFQEAAALEAAS